MLFAYFGPETTLPFISIIAAFVGFMMTIGRFITSRFIPKSLRARLFPKKRFDVRK